MLRQLIDALNRNAKATETMSVNTAALTAAVTALTTAENNLAAAIENNNDQAAQAAVDAAVGQLNTIATDLASLAQTVGGSGATLAITPTSVSGTVGGSTPVDFTATGGVAPYIDWAIDGTVEGLTLNADGTGTYAPTVANAGQTQNVSCVDSTTPTPLKGSVAVTFTAS